MGGYRSFLPLNNPERFIMLFLMRFDGSMSDKSTIYDIAKKLGIAASTVSRALNDHPRISDATKKMVLKAAQEMDYEPNKLALGLKKGKSSNVGVVVPFINRHFFSNVIRGIEDALYPQGYNVVICQTHDEGKKEVDTVMNLLNAQIEGILISVSKSNETTFHLEQVIKKKVPLIFFDRQGVLPNVGAVRIDDYQGAFDATQHLIENGCMRIAHLGMDGYKGIYGDRFQGYKDALRKNGQDFDKELTLCIKSDIDEGAAAIKKLMGLKNPPDALFSSSDFAAMGCHNWLTQNGYTIPDDICIVGFSNEPFTQFVRPSISSVDQSPREMGKVVAQVFCEQANDISKVNVERNVVLPASLVIRDSSLASKVATAKRPSSKE